MIDAMRADLFSFEARVERSMERAYEILATHQVVEADLFGDEEPKLEEATRQGADEVAAMTYVAAVMEAQSAGVEDGMISRLDLRRRIEKLYTVEREVMGLVAEEGMTYDEAARKLRVHPCTVQRRHATALRKLHAFFVERRWRPG